MWIGGREVAMEDASQLADNTLEINMNESERKEIVADVLQKMPTGDALLLTLYYMEDNPVKEIARITGLNEPNVKVKLFRARKLFKEMVVSNYGVQITGT
jgi:RNA polymerase sigma-70 factor (ECF subfamily)